MKRSELRQMIEETLREAKKRSPSQIKRDLKRYLDILAIGEELKDPEIIRHAKKEIKAMEDELTHLRYGRTDVK